MTFIWKNTHFTPENSTFFLKRNKKIFELPKTRFCALHKVQTDNVASLTIFINNLVCVVKAYTTLGVAIGVVFFGVVRGGFEIIILITHIAT